MAAHTITDKEYADLCEQLEATKQDADRLRLLKSVLRTEDFLFECRHIAGVVEIIAYGDPKVKAAIALHARCTDVANFDSVLAKFRFAEDQQAIKAALGL